MSGPSQAKEKQTPIISEYERMWNYRLKHRVVLRVCFSFASNAASRIELFEAYYRKAKEAFQRHNIDIEACPFGHLPNERNTFSFDGKFWGFFDDSLRRTVAKLHPEHSHRGHVPAIYCHTNGWEQASKSGATSEPGDWLRYIILDPRAPIRDGLTLAHEMGHAAEIRDHRRHHHLDTPETIEAWELKGLPYRPIMSYLPSRNRFTSFEVAGFAQCYFRR